MTASPWYAVPDGWQRDVTGFPVAHIDTTFRVHYRLPGGAWHERKADDLVSAMRTAEAGLRLMGVGV